MNLPVTWCCINYHFKAKLKPPITALGAIRPHHLPLIRRACGDNALVAVASLVNTIPLDMTVQQVRRVP